MELKGWNDSFPPLNLWSIGPTMDYPSFIRTAQMIVEKDPNGYSPKEPGAKLDAGKPAIYQGLFAYFPRACESVAAVSTFGASKYSWKGWESVPNGFERYSDALARHLTKEGLGEFKDPDSKFPHAAHVAWNALARLELILKEMEIKNETNKISIEPGQLNVNTGLR